jgi:SAM-dependent methyltransferase
MSGLLINQNDDTVRASPARARRGRPRWPGTRLSRRQQLPEPVGAFVAIAGAPLDATSDIDITLRGMLRTLSVSPKPRGTRWQGLTHNLGHSKGRILMRDTLPVNDDGLLAEQQEYYRARAPEYDEWWQRRGRYDRGPGLAEEWHRQVAQVADALETFGATGDVLEMAGGTGWWTARLARTAGHLTVIDSSPETLDLNRDHVGRSDVDYLVSDLFTWQPQRTYDVVFFSFWLSHVPRSRFSGFWSLVRSCLAPGGRVFLVDNRNDPHPTGETKDPYVVQCGPDLELRRLHDGSKYQVVEVFYEPKELQSLLGHQGWTARLDATRCFIFGEACLAEARPLDGPDGRASAPG